MMQTQGPQVPLCFDLDGTLIRTDMLFESAGRYLGKNPLRIFALVYWLFHGKARLKSELARRVSIDAAQLPYNPSVLELARVAKDRGEQVFLATASNQKYAADVARHLDVFDGVFATTDGGDNLAGSGKAAVLTDKFGDRGFSYVGDSRKDLKVWEHAREAYVVGNGVSKFQLDATGAEVTQLAIEPKPLFLRSLLKQLRVHQWAKNVLIFLPLLASHSFLHIDPTFRTLLTFLAFSFLASAVYVVNDIEDIDSDRAHPTKRYRPLAAGSINPLVALSVAGVMAVAGIVLAVVSGWLVLLVLLGYFVATNLYSFFLKRIVIADVVTLAMLYTIRVLAGAAAIKVMPSMWLLAFSVFVFFSLACMKRLAELMNHGDSAAAKRGYTLADRSVLLALGASSGVVAVLVIGLYVNSPEVPGKYSMPELLWLLIPLMMYWLGRAWLFTERGAMKDDPVLFAIKDKVSLAVFGLMLAVLVLASVV